MFDLPACGELDAWLAHRESLVPGLKPGCEKQILWADGKQRRPLALVYVHGFSATGHELRPLPDLVARGLGANLFFTRLTGHGQDSAAMGQARLHDWRQDVEEALEIGAKLGEDVLLMGCSTGCTLLTMALAGGAQAKGVINISPNYGLRHPVAQLAINLPGIRHWGPWLAGRERSFAPISQAHEHYWTTRYDIQAVFTMAEAVRAAHNAPIEMINTPAYFAFCEQDEVVHPRETKGVIRRWGGPVQPDILIRQPGDATLGHVMAGDVFYPSGTTPLAGRILDWARSL